MAKEIVQEAGSDPADTHCDSAIELAKQNIGQFMLRKTNTQEVANLLKESRSGSATNTVYQVKMLKRMVSRTAERRLRIEILEEKKLDLQHRDVFTDIEEKSHEMVMDEAEERIKLERNHIEKDGAFAREITETIAEELSGLEGRWENGGIIRGCCQMYEYWDTMTAYSTTKCFNFGVLGYNYSETEVQKPPHWCTTS